jgi:hypothetical protein
MSLQVMGHGGGAMQFCPEETVSGGTALRWMDVAEAAAELARFNSSLAGRLGLIFLQNCCKATLPAFWPFRHLDCCLVASPTIIAAPNSYYASLIHHVSTCPAPTPASAASVICHNEQPEDFAVLSVFHTSQLQPFSLALNALAAAAALHLRHAAAARAFDHSLRSFWIECVKRIPQRVYFCNLLGSYSYTNELGQRSTDSYVDVLALCSALQTSAAGEKQLAPHLLQRLQVFEAPPTKI